MPSLEAWRFATEEGAPVAESMDEAASQAPTRAAWHCAKGCAACCYLMVESTSREIDALVPCVTPAIGQRIRANALVARGLDAGAYRLARPRCAFLDTDGLCAAYEVRPVRCRSHVSSDVEVCRRGLAGEQPGCTVPGDGWLRSVASAVQEGLGGATRELHQALAERLDD